MESMFAYTVRVGSGADLLRAGIYPVVLPNCGEIIINSHEFASFEECEKNLNSLMTVLTRHEASASDKNLVVVSKIHPQLDTSGRKHADANTWDKFTIMRAYVADSDELKNSTLKYHVMGQIRTNRDISNFRAELIEPAETVEVDDAG